MVRDLLKERQDRQQEASLEIASSWSRKQLSFGAVLMAPAVTEKVAQRKEHDGMEAHDRAANGKNEVWLCLLPEDYSFQASIESEWRHRGIFRSPVYKGQITAPDSWAEPDLGELGYASANIDWSRAIVMHKVSDPRGMADVEASIDGANASASPGLRGPYEAEWTKLEHAQTEAMPRSFELFLGLKGSERFSLFPMGKTGRAEIASDWSIEA